MEFSLIGMGLVMLIFGTVEFGRGFYLYNKASYAADLAARKGITGLAVSDDLIKSEIRSAFDAAEATPEITISVGTLNDVDYRKVEIAVPFTLMIPGFPSSMFKLKVTRRIPTLS